MKGKDLISYILDNNLENEELFKNGIFDPKIIGLMSMTEAAAKYGVGLATMKVLYNSNKEKGVIIGNEVYFPIKIIKAIPLKNWKK